MRPQFLLVLLIPVLAACQGPAYHPLKNGVGFSEVPIGSDGFQISYTGDSNMSVTEARRMAMIRASELAVLQNKPYFQVQGEQIYVSAGTRYFPATDVPYVQTFRDRAGRTRAYIYHSYDPGYVEQYTVPDVEMQVRLTTESAAPSIPASYLLRQAEADKIPLSPGVPERLSGLPAVGDVTLPPEPAPATRPLH